MKTCMVINSEVSQQEMRSYKYRLFSPQRESEGFVSTVLELCFICVFS